VMWDVTEEWPVEQKLNSDQKASDEETSESANQTVETETMNELLTAAQQLEAPSQVSQETVAGFLDAVIRDVTEEWLAEQELNGDQESQDGKAFESTNQTTETETMNELLTAAIQLVDPSQVSQKTDAGFLDLVIQNVTEESIPKQELNSDQESPNEETSEAMHQAAEIETMNQLPSAAPQVVDQSQVSQETDAGFLDAVSDKNSASESAEPPNKKMKPAPPQAQLQKPLWYTNNLINSLSLNTKAYNREESMQLLAAMWRNIVEMRGVDPEEAKLRQAPAAMLEKVVTNDRRDAARRVTESLKDLSDWELLSVQLDIEQTWRNFESRWGSGDSTCILL